MEELDHLRFGISLAWSLVRAKHFVLACRRLCKRSVSSDDVKIAYALLMQFCKRVHRLYDKSCMTPNMHLHAHLAACVNDYGPCHTFWLFSFERYSGILDSQPTNNCCIEIQLMARFLKDTMHLELLQRVDSTSMPLTDVFGEFVSGHTRHVSSLSTTPESSGQTNL